jgi:hypothetical protein
LRALAALPARDEAGSTAKGRLKMKAFLAALLFFGVALTATGFVFREAISYTATEAYSTPSARVGHVNPVDGRLGWTPDH